MAVEKRKWSKKSVVKNYLWLLAEKPLRIFELIFVTGLIARSMSLEEFGLYNYILSLAFLVSFVLDLGLSKLLAKNFTEYSKVYLGDYLVVRCFGSIIFALFFSLIFYTGYETSQGLILFWVLRSLSIFDFLVGYFHASAKNNVVATVNILVNTLVVLLLFIGIQEGRDIEYFLIINGLRHFLVSFLYGMVFFNWRKQIEINPRLSRLRISKLVSGGLPISVAGLFSMLYLKFDTVMLENLDGLSSVSIYTTASRFSEMWFFMVIALGNILLPVMASSSGSQELTSLGTGLRASIAIFLVSGGILIIFGKSAILRLYGADFTESYDVLRIHLLYGLQVSFFAIWSRWIIVRGKEYLIMVNQVLAFAFNFALNLILIPRLGAIGAAYATAFGAILAQILIVFTYRPAEIARAFFKITQNDSGLNHN